MPMNTIKITSNKVFTTEQHNPRVMNLHNVVIFGKKMTISDPCNLNVFITNKCHNDCKFCINKCNGTDKIDTYDYLESFKKVASELCGKGFEITITGGEPTLNPSRLVEVMSMCHYYGLPCRTFSTTGMGIKNLYRTYPIYEYMKDYGFGHNINISRMAIDDEINNAIFGNDMNLTERDIFKLNEFFKIHSMEMRISTPLISFCKGHVRESKDMKRQFMDFASYFMQRGVDSVIFRELIGKQYEIDNDYRLQEVEEGPFKKIAHDFKSSLRYCAKGGVVTPNYFISEFANSEYVFKIYEMGKFTPEQCTVLSHDLQLKDVKDYTSSLSFRDGGLYKGYGITKERLN